ncbi:MAG: hypothetical protein V4547_16400 [Bacteroidota bacterium]
MSKVEVNSEALRKWTSNLEKLGKADMPVAVRATLNGAAFDVKKNTLGRSAKDNFKHLKRETFFKKFSGVDKANGLNIMTMRATVGMLDMGQATARAAVSNMTKQEIGGQVDDGLAYLKAARGSNINGSVRRENYYNKDKVISGRSKIGRNKGSRKSKFVARAFRSLKENKPMFINSMKGNFLMKVMSIHKSKDGRVKIKSKLLLKVRTSVNIQATHFMEEAAAKTTKKLPAMFINEAQKRINKRMK